MLKIAEQGRRAPGKALHTSGPFSIESKAANECLWSAGAVEASITVCTTCRRDFLQPSRARALEAADAARVETVTGPPRSPSHHRYLAAARAAIAALSSCKFLQDLRTSTGSMCSGAFTQIREPVPAPRGHCVRRASRAAMGDMPHQQASSGYTGSIHAGCLRSALSYVRVGVRVSGRRPIIAALLRRDKNALRCRSQPWH